VPLRRPAVPVCGIGPEVTCCPGPGMRGRREAHFQPLKLEPAGGFHSGPSTQTARTSARPLRYLLPPGKGHVATPFKGSGYQKAYRQVRFSSPDPRRAHHGDRLNLPGLLSREGSAPNISEGEIGEEWSYVRLTE